MGSGQDKTLTVTAQLLQAAFQNAAAGAYTATCPSASLPERRNLGTRRTPSAAFSASLRPGAQPSIPAALLLLGFALTAWSAHRS